jgi:mRNA interferase MazF
VTRGDVFIAAMVGDYAKPRPVIIVQSDAVRALQSTIVCPTTTFAEPVAIFRPMIEPTADNGLLLRSYAMIEKIGAVPLHRFRERIGHVGLEAMAEVDRALAILFGLA